MDRKKESDYQRKERIFHHSKSTGLFLGPQDLTEIPMALVNIVDN